jgi:DNA-binding FadR family transcriptional regulator
MRGWHEKIYEAIAAHDAEAADAAMAAHLTMVSDAYWKAIAAKTK